MGCTYLSEQTFFIYGQPNYNFSDGLDYEFSFDKKRSFIDTGTSANNPLQSDNVNNDKHAL